MANRIKRRINLKKTLLALSVLASTMYGETINPDNIALSFMNGLIEKNPNKDIRVNNVSIGDKMAIKGAKGFTAYIMRINVSTKTGSDTDVYDSFFVSSTGLVSTKLYDVEGNDLSMRILPKLTPKDFYDDKHLAIGTGSRKHKIVFISDPLCPYCREVYPKIKASVKDSGEKYDLYQMELPLVHIHPASLILSAVIKQARRKNITGLIDSIYTNDEYKSITSFTDPDKIIDFVEKTSKHKINRDEIKNIDLKEIEKDGELCKSIFVNQTPIIFLDGIVSEESKIK